MERLRFNESVFAMPWYDENREIVDSDYIYLSHKNTSILQDFLDHQEENIASVLKKYLGSKPNWERVNPNTNDYTCKADFELEDKHITLYFMDNAFHLEPQDDFPGYPPPSGAVGRWGIKIWSGNRLTVSKRSRWHMFFRVVYDVYTPCVKSLEGLLEETLL
jgi:hypothetical protein